MTADNRALGDLSTTPVDYDGSYYDSGHLGAGDYGWDSDHWRSFFTGVAERIVGLVAPKNAYDVGCAKGLLVQALAELGVDARGSDISEYAIESAHPDVAGRLSLASAADPIDGRYDLVTCIEVLEHMAPDEAQKAIDSMCAATDTILFSSTPADFHESTHVNVHPTAQWAAWFAERGFFRRTDADTTFVTPWAILFERADLSMRSVVSRYEEKFAPLHAEVIEKRRALLEANRTISELKRVSREVASNDESILSRHAALIARDNVIGLEAQIGTLQNQLARARQRLVAARERLKQRNEELDALRRSRSYRVGRTLLKPASWLKR
jgi:SAM-dependent methyltransferase